MRKAAKVCLLVLTFVGVVGCEEIKKSLRLNGATQTATQTNKIDPRAVPSECEMPYGLYWVRARVQSAFVGSWCNYSYARWSPGFGNDEQVWWGGTDTYGPDHKASRNHIGNCVFEYTEGHFVGTERRRPKEGIVEYEGRWEVNNGQVKCGAIGTETFSKHP